MRKSKVSADISLEAHTMLRDYCEKHERSKGFLLEKMIRKFCSVDISEGSVAKVALPETTTEKGGMNKAKRSTPRKAASYPSNLDEQFEMLWDTKGKKGAKNGNRGAYEIFKKLAANVDDETCETFTKMLIDDILKNSGECGYPEMHLTSYLNQQRWDK